MAKNKTLLIEIGTEELPPKALQNLSIAFSNSIVDGLNNAGIEYGDYHSFATPRRLAVSIGNVSDAQPDREVEKKGPSVKAAFDADGKPTKALEGFAKSCGAEISDLQKQETDKGAWFIYKASQKGKALTELLPEIISRSLTKLPVPKRMRWGNGDAEFVRPVHWVLILHGADIIDCEILGIQSGRTTLGHRFHTQDVLSLHEAEDYAEQLQADGFVIADMQQRMKIIREQVENTASKLGGKALINDDLVDEVASLVEWPVAIAGEFDKTFLDVPAEALIKTMQDNQKYFPVVDKKNKLKNCFITISNIESKTPEKIKAGNERVIRPRLADAKFFWEHDKKHPLESWLPSLDNVVLQTKLGSLGDKTRRLGQIAEYIATQTDTNVEHCKRAALLSKCDLMTEMVGEFPALQGVMGRYYLQAAGEAEQVAQAIDEQYMPRHAGDSIAASMVGRCIAISDKIDTVVSIFAIGQKPTGEKDPYGLRRAALGILRTIIEGDLDLDLKELINVSAKALADKVDASKVTADVLTFIYDRLRAYYIDRDISVDVFDAVLVLQPSKPLDFDKRIKAVTAFRVLPEAESLAAANKRVRNILKKSDRQTNLTVNDTLLQEKSEIALFKKIQSLQKNVEDLYDKGDYEKALRQLSALRKPVDEFFDNVMVMADDEAIRSNRIALLSQMSELFLRTADLSRLQS